MPEGKVLEGWLAQWRGSVASGLPIVFAGLVGGATLAISEFGSLWWPNFGALGGVSADSVLSDSKKPAADFPMRACCNDEKISVICPTCQLFDAQIAERRQRLK